MSKIHKLDYRKHSDGKEEDGGDSTPPVVKIAEGASKKFWEMLEISAKNVKRFAGPPVKPALVVAQF